jgi:nucleotide-binding universal stress UspA family protein
MTTQPIVVGVDGSPAGLSAVDLAVREADLRNRPIRVVYANTWASHPAWVDVAPSGQVAQRLAAEPRETVDAALERIAASSSVPATGEIATGHPAAVLVHASQRAALLVVGHRGRSLLALGSVARNVAAHAACPVLVARGALDAGGEVLVGVDGSPCNDAAVGFGFEEAALRGVDLVAVHAWTGPVSTGPGDMLPLTYDADEVAAEEARVLAEALAGWQDKYPDVIVIRRLVRTHAVRALKEATGRAQVVVVGTHGHRAVPGWLVGSVTHALLHQARCPIVVVPHGDR